MLFNSIEFIFLFLPIAFIVYFILNKRKLTTAATVWLVFTSLFFYSWWNIAYLPLILVSMIINYAIGIKLGQDSKAPAKKALLTVGMIFNISLLGYFKYSDFFITNINQLFDADFSLLYLALPLAISFFTFQQIAYLIDAYRGETKKYIFLNYCLFVTFFPQLIAGPIVQHHEIMPQFADEEKKKINLQNIAMGIFIFCIGLFKKVVIADTFAIWATKGFDQMESLTFVEGWLVSLSYTFQLYFDFSGYTDMAMGAALLFNIKLPVNFNSPYKALNIQDFWRRWHITLSRFLTSYLYIPLGGNRKGKVRTYVNIMIIFLVSGFWHGAGWTFIFWGFLHGAASVICRYWSKFNIRMPKWLAWFITFNFVNAAWVFFRATTWSDAMKVLKAMAGMNGFTLPPALASTLASLQQYGVQFGDMAIENGNLLFVYLLIAFIVILLCKNSMQLLESFKPNWTSSLFITSTIFIIIYVTFKFNRNSEFLYFNF